MDDALQTMTGVRHSDIYDGLNMKEYLPSEQPPLCEDAEFLSFVR
jgi:hypothetical protein